MDYVAVSKAVHKWHPFAGMVYFHLLLDSLSRSGVLDRASSPEDV
jgi:hypothetical protein